MFGFIFQAFDAFALLIICSLGLAVIFGLMRIINLAHGEFIMFGAYTAVIATHNGLWFPFSVLLGGVVSGIAGLVLERLLICRFYGRSEDSLVATWAVSLVVSQTMLILSGQSIPGVETPLGTFSVGDLSFSIYRAALIVVAIALLGIAYLIFMKTPLGVFARATIQDPEMARALGLNTNVVYSATFAIGAALAGLAGGLYAPMLIITPMMGSAYLVPAFTTVIVGGANILVGIGPAAATLSLLQTGIESWYGPTIARIGLLIAVVCVVRFLPKGFSALRERQ
jgi:branched-subunit amino acid ABC-type transport system permease component